MALAIVFIILMVGLLGLFHTYFPSMRKCSPPSSFAKVQPVWKILHLSDLHLGRIGIREKLAIQICHRTKPDMIVITGDIIADLKNVNNRAVLSFFQNIKSNIPIFIVRGNAEFVKPNANDPLALLNTLANVEILSNRIVTLRKSGGRLTLIGLDPYVDTTTPFTAQKTRQGFHISGGGSWVDCFYNLECSNGELSKIPFLRHYIVEGCVKVRSEQDLGGILVCSQIPQSRDRFYRLTFGGGYPIRFSSHGTVIDQGDRFSERVLSSNSWHKYKIEVNIRPDKTWLNAKVWSIKESEPENTLLECGDSSKNKITAGTIGFWSSRGGAQREYILERIYDVKEDCKISFAHSEPEQVFEQSFVDEAPWSDLTRLNTKQHLSQLMQELSPKGLNILLCHDPDIITFLMDSKIDLVLSGHTHGGQISIPVLQEYFYGYSAKGLRNMVESDKARYPYLILNKGLGTSGIPFRLGARCEVILVEV